MVEQIEVDSVGSMEVWYEAWQKDKCPTLRTASAAFSCLARESSCRYRDRGRADKGHPTK